MHKKAVLHDDTSNHDDENDPANHYDSEKHELISDKAGLAFRIKDGVPIMLLEEAREISS